MASQSNNTSAPTGPQPDDAATQVNISQAGQFRTGSQTASPDYGTRNRNRRYWNRKKGRNTQSPPEQDDSHKETQLPGETGTGELTTGSTQSFFTRKYADDDESTKPQKTDACQLKDSIWARDTDKTTEMGETTKKVQDFAQPVNSAPSFKSFYQDTPPARKTESLFTQKCGDEDESTKPQKTGACQLKDSIWAPDTDKTTEMQGSAKKDQNFAQPVNSAPSFKNFYQSTPPARKTESLFTQKYGDEDESTKPQKTPACQLKDSIWARDTSKAETSQARKAYNRHPVNIASESVNTRHVNGASTSENPQPLNVTSKRDNLPQNRPKTESLFLRKDDEDESTKPQKTDLSQLKNSIWARDPIETKGSLKEEAPKKAETAQPDNKAFELDNSGQNNQEGRGTESVFLRKPDDDDSSRPQKTDTRGLKNSIWANDTTETQTTEKGQEEVHNSPGQQEKKNNQNRKFKGKGRAKFVPRQN